VFLKVLFLNIARVFRFYNSGFTIYTIVEWKLKVMQCRGFKEGRFVLVLGGCTNLDSLWITIFEYIVFQPFYGFFGCNTLK